jgi:hypothetical protein
MTQTATAQSLAQAAIPQEDADRKREMQWAWKAYHGKIPNQLKVEPNKPNDNVRPNLCASIVDKGVSYLCGKPVKIEAIDEKKTKVDGQPSPIQDFLDGFWGDDDEKMTLLTEIAMNGGVCGQTFVKIIPATRRMKYPRIVNLNPLLVRMVTHPEDCKIILAFVIEYPISYGLQKRQIIARVDPDSNVELWGDNNPEDFWTITNYQRRAMGGGQDSWQQAGEQKDWPYPFPPIFTNQNLPNPNESWGITDLTEEIIDQNRSYQFAMSNTARVIRYHAHPKTIAKGVRAEQINTAVDDVICLPDPSSDMKNLEMTSNLESSRAFAGDIRSNINVQSRVPAIALGTDEPKGQISGVALMVYYQPILEKTTEKQRLYGKLIREVSRAALVLAGLIPVERFDDYKIGLHWPPLLPIDNLAAAQEGMVLEQLGVSQDTVLQGLGYNAADEAEKKANEDARQLTAFSRGQGLPPALPAPEPAAPPPAESPFLGRGPTA